MKCIIFCCFFLIVNIITGAPKLFNFNIKDSHPNRVYFESSETLNLGTTVVGFKIYGNKTISNVTINSGSTTGHYLTTTTNFTWWDNNTIEYTGGSDIQTAGGDRVIPFTLTFIENNIAEPSTSVNRYVTVTATGGGDGRSESTAWTLSEAAANATSGMTIWIRAGTYAPSSTGFTASNSGTVTSPIKLIGYTTTPGDITNAVVDGSNFTSRSELLKTLDEKTYPLFVGDSTNNHYGIYLNAKNYWIIKNIQVTRFLYGVNIRNSSYVVLENVNASDNYIGRRDNSANNAVGIMVGWHTGFNQDYIRLLKCLTFDNQIIGMLIRGDNSAILKSEAYVFYDGSYENGMDYQILSEGGDNSIIKDCYVRRSPSVKHTGHGIPVRKGSFNLVDNCTVVDMENDVFVVAYAGSEHNVFKNNKLLYISETDMDYGLTVRDGANNNIFENNYLEHLKNGIYFANTEENEGFESESSIGRNNIFRNNVFFDCTNSAILFLKGRNSGPMMGITGNKIYNNTFVKSPRFFRNSGIIKDSISSNEYINNIIYDISTYVNGDTSLSQIWNSNNLYKSFKSPYPSKNYNLNPGFTNFPTDLTLTSSSAIKNLGATIPGIYYDYNWNERYPGSFSIGAYQYQSGNTISVPIADFIVNDKTPSISQTVVFTDISANKPTSWQWIFNPTSVTYMDGTSSTSKNPHIKFNSVTAYSCTLRVSNSAGSDLEVKANLITVSPDLGVKFNVSVFLAGPYANNSMNTSLNANGFLPKKQPFNNAPWNYPGTESVNGFADNVVDWVLVELRTSTSPSTVIVRRAGLLKSNGEISEILNSSFNFSNVPVGDYYIVIYHRNHLSVMSSQKVHLTSNSVHYDFRSSQNKAYGTNSMQNLGDGYFGLYSGDGNSDGVISNDDIQDLWIPQFLNSIDGYQAGDFNLDGSVTASDNNVYWLPNNGKKIGFPN